MRKSPGRQLTLPDHMFRLLEGAQRRMVSDLVAQADSLFSRGSFARLVDMIPPEGIRITDFAALSNMTKQSLGEFVDAMEADGLVESRRLPTDRRVRLVTRTAKGDTYVDHQRTLIAKVERAWREEVGAERYEVMKDALRTLGADMFDVPA